MIFGKHVQNWVVVSCRASHSSSPVKFENPFFLKCSALGNFDPIFRLQAYFFKWVGEKNHPTVEKIKVRCLTFRGPQSFQKM